MKKIAIRVKNKKQFDALMKHYESKGWKTFSDLSPHRVSSVWNVPAILQYHDYFGAYNENQISHEIIDFDTFSQLTGVKVADEIELKFSQLVTGKVTKDRIDFYANGENHAISFLDKKDIDGIYTAINSLQ